MNKLWSTVLTVDTINKKITVKFDNGQTSNKAYRYPKGSTPNIGDRAFFIFDICVGIY